MKKLLLLLLLTCGIASAQYTAHSGTNSGTVYQIVSGDSQFTNESTALATGNFNWNLVTWRTGSSAASDELVLADRFAVGVTNVTGVTIYGHRNGNVMEIIPIRTQHLLQDYFYSSFRDPDTAIDQHAIEGRIFPTVGEAISAAENGDHVFRRDRNSVRYTLPVFGVEYLINEWSVSTNAILERTINTGEDTSTTPSYFRVMDALEGWIYSSDNGGYMTAPNGRVVVYNTNNGDRWFIYESIEDTTSEGFSRFRVFFSEQDVIDNIDATLSYLGN